MEIEEIYFEDKFIYYAVHFGEDVLKQSEIIEFIYKEAFANNTEISSQ